MTSAPTSTGGGAKGAAGGGGTGGGDTIVARILDRALDGVRALVRREALPGICRNAIHHAVETLRRAGLKDEARRILIAEIGDLDLAQSSRPALEREERRLTVIAGGRS